jgi:hypothetical protein
VSAWVVLCSSVSLNRLVSTSNVMVGFMGVQQVFVGRRVEIDRLGRELAGGGAPYGSRVVPVLVGPSGVGKTSLSRRVLDWLSEKGFYTVHLEVSRPPKTVQELLEMFASSVPGRAALGQLAREIVESVLERLLGPGFESRAILLSSIIKGGGDPLEVIADIVEKLASRVSREGFRGLIVVLDEAQNLLKALGVEDLWSFIKVTADLQEYPPASTIVRFLIVTGDYGFQRRLFGSAPSLDYLDTFYLGEMTLEDSSQLYSQLCGAEPDPSTLEAIGGHPVHVREYCIRGPHYYCRTVRKFQEAIKARLRRLVEEQDETVLDYLAKLVERPLPLGGIPLKVEESLDELVKANILQYACHDYLGIYSWNRGCSKLEPSGCGGGGFCGSLDTLAPAHRPALVALKTALQSLTGSTPSGSEKLYNTYKRICTSQG